MKFFTTACIFLFVMKSYSQQIEKHQWKHRVLLIFSETKNDDLLKKQIQFLKKDKEGLQVRKLVIYTFTKTEFRFQIDGNWRKSPDLYNQFIKEKNPFQVFLIGLDGGIKLKKSELLTTEQLFTIIDGMPMRKREIKRKNE